MLSVTNRPLMLSVVEPYIIMLSVGRLNVVAPIGPLLVIKPFWGNLNVLSRKRGRIYQVETMFLLKKLSTYSLI
jgi:hypothetical protein